MNPILEEGQPHRRSRGAAGIAARPHAALAGGAGTARLFAALLLAAAANAFAAPAEPPAPAPRAPFSAYASPEARAQFHRLREEDRQAAALTTIEQKRAFYDAINRDRVERMRKRYAVTTRERRYGGVLADVVEPRGGPRDRRVLINLHGGAFLWGARSGALVESIPIAALSGMTVVSVDYRQGPEHAFPAASEDVEAVYRALLDEHRAEDIGVYGCSAGGYLAAQAVARFIARRLPLPGAVGILCAGFVPPDGDSVYFAPLLDGAPMRAAPPRLSELPYLRDAPMHDPQVFPGLHPDYVARFPPTLLITGTRDFLMSAAVRSHALLAAAGVPAELHVYDGMAHAFFSDPEPPESRAAYDAVVAFFKRHLGARAGTAR